MQKSEGSTAHTDPEDQGGCGLPPEQQKCYSVKAVSPRHCIATTSSNSSVSTTQLQSQLLCRAVTKTMSVASHCLLVLLVSFYYWF